MMKDKLHVAYKRLSEAENILLITHNKPDGDALSSICSMMVFLRGLGKNYAAFCADKPPYQYNFLPYIHEVENDRDKIDIDSFDTIVVLDCGSLSRTYMVRAIKGRRRDQYLIEFDHHPKMDEYADLEIRMVGRSSTAEVLYEFYKENKVRFTKQLASCVLTGILTDTGNLLYESTSDRTIRISSEMLLSGARYPAILESTWRNKSLDGMKVWGKALSSLKVNRKYDFAVSVLTKDDLDEDNVSEEELEGVAGFLSNLHGVKGVLFLREVDNTGKIKGSLRTNDPKINVSKIAEALGGGGHRRASGFVIEGRLEKEGEGWKIV